MTPVVQSKWLRFEEAPNTGRKTGTWHVLAKQNGAQLGEIRWYGPWRQYAFFPQAETVLAGSCFTDLAVFIRLAATARRGPRTADEEGTG